MFHDNSDITVKRSQFIDQCSNATSIVDNVEWNQSNFAAWSLGCNGAFVF